MNNSQTHTAALSAAKLRDRCCGAMLGLAIGDALGYPVEFLNRTQIMEKYGPRGITDFVPVRGHDRMGLYSDDTQMSIAVARALLASDLHSLDDVMAHVKEEFIAWASSSQNNRSPGQACMDGIRNMANGVHWFSAGDPYSKGCGAAMRVGALAVEPEYAFDIVGAGWVGEEAVAGAMYAFLRSPDDFAATVLLAANACQTNEQSKSRGRCDSDSIACIAGAISGAYNGLQAIPRRWAETVEDGEQLVVLGEQLARAWTSSK